MKKDRVYIFGHKNPDADAICSAIAYEAFKHATGHKEFVALPVAVIPMLVLKQF